MRKSWLYTAVSSLALFAFAPVHAQTQPALAGNYVYHAQGSDDINAKIADAKLNVPSILRGEGRRRLRNANPAYKTLAISYNPTQVTVATDQWNLTRPANGTPQQWTRKDGEKFMVSHEWKNGRLEQTFRAPDAVRVNEYVMSPDGRMITMNVTITSEKLKEPLRYKLMYHRT